jgi:hypothetical protein
VQQVFNAMAVLAFLGVILLAFAGSAMLRMLRDLQDSVVGTFGLGDERIPELAAPGGGERHVLVVEHNCVACRDRVAAIRALPEAPSGLVVLGDTADVRDWLGDAANAPEVIVEPAVWNAVAVTATPTMLRVDAAGTVLWRRIVGSNEELTALLAPATSATATPTTTPEAGPATVPASATT